MTGTAVSTSAIWLTALVAAAEDARLAARHQQQRHVRLGGQEGRAREAWVLNTAPGTDIFTYYFRDSAGNFIHSASSRSPAAQPVANLRDVQIELIVDANVSHTPTYVDLRTTVRPRNAGAVSKEDQR